MESCTSEKERVHYSGDDRNLSLVEMIRVAKQKVVVYCPLEDGEKFKGRKYDYLLYSWLVKSIGITKR